MKINRGEGLGSEEEIDFGSPDSESPKTEILSSREILEDMKKQLMEDIGMGGRVFRPLGMKENWDNLIKVYGEHADKLNDREKQAIEYILKQEERINRGVKSEPRRDIAA